MSACLTARALFEANRDALGLSWAAAEDYADRSFSWPRGAKPEPSAAVVAPFKSGSEPVAPLIVSSHAELRRWAGLWRWQRARALGRLFSLPRVCVVVTDGRVPAAWRRVAERSRVPLLLSTRSGSEALEGLRDYVTELEASTVTIHGVFVEVFGLGVQLTGPSGIGKSELALELISRGHRLVADDAPSFSRVTQGRVLGCCPLLLRDFLEVRGLGVLNIRSLFGDKAIATGRQLDLVIALERGAAGGDSGEERLQGSRTIGSVLGVAVPRFDLKLAPGRNLAVLSEAAVRSELLERQGYRAAEDFIGRQNRVLRNGNE